MDSKVVDSKVIGLAQGTTQREIGFLVRSDHGSDLNLIDCRLMECDCWSARIADENGTFQAIALYMFLEHSQNTFRAMARNDLFLSAIPQSMSLIINWIHFAFS